MKIKSVLIAVPIGEKYEVGHEVNGVIIDDIICNVDTKVIFCYDVDGEPLVEIGRDVPVVIEYVGVETNV